MEITEAIKSIPEKKEKLRKAFEALQSYSSSLASFDLQWEDIDNHFSAIEKSVQDRIKSLQGKEDAGAPCEAIRTARARPELTSLCVMMDAKGLLSYISRNMIDLTAIRNELPSAIRCAPDPAQLVLDAMDVFYPPNFDINFYPKTKTKFKLSRKEEVIQTNRRICIYPPNFDTNFYTKSKKVKLGPKQEVIQTNRRICIDLLETLHLISSEIEIKPSVRENAKKLAIQWRPKVHPTGDDYSLEVSAFLQLTASYDLVSYFNSEDVLDLFISVSRRKRAIELFKSLRLVDKLPVFIQKLNSKGRQLDAIKFVYAFDLTDKYPPVPLLKAYVAEAKKMAQEVLVKRSYSVASQNAAIAKEIEALRLVIRAVTDYELESEYPLEQLESRTAVLEESKVDIKKRRAAAAAAAEAAAAATPKSNPQQHQQLSNKRQRSSGGPISSNPPPYHPPFAQNTQQPQPQLGAAEHTPVQQSLQLGSIQQQQQPVLHQQQFVSPPQQQRGRELSSQAGGRRPGKGVVCNFCRRPGHVYKECRRANNLCLACGSANHVAVACPKNLTAMS